MLYHRCLRLEDIGAFGVNYSQPHLDNGKAIKRPERKRNGSGPSCFTVHCTFIDEALFSGSKQRTRRSYFEQPHDEPRLSPATKIVLKETEPPVPLVFAVMLSMRFRSEPPVMKPYFAAEP